MREAFSKILQKSASENPNIFLLTGDHGYSLFDGFRKTTPKQYINAGIAEQNMIGVAAGLSMSGFLPIVYGLSAFIPVRVVEQIKMDICYLNLPCIFIGDGAGFVYSSLGTSHQSTEDIACLRSIPNLTILSPCDHNEFLAVFKYALQKQSPVYIRIGKADLGNFHQNIPALESGALFCISESSRKNLALVATGSMVSTAMALRQELPEATVFSAPFIKPLTKEKVSRQLSSFARIVVLEEHSTFGGLGGALSEILSESGSVPILKIGVDDRFSKYCGSYQYLLDEHGLTKQKIFDRISSWEKSLSLKSNTLAPKSFE
jgi:transketolase